MEEGLAAIFALIQKIKNFHFAIHYSPIAALMLSSAFKLKLKTVFLVLLLVYVYRCITDSTCSNASFYVYANGMHKMQ